MKRIALLIALLFVGSTYPMLMVHVDLSNGVQISEYERTTGRGEDWRQGSWKLILLDRYDRPLVETTFEPSMIDWRGIETTVDDLWVSIRWHPMAMRMEVRDENGRVRATRDIAATCGDGRCDFGEEETCREDCPLGMQAGQAVQAYEERFAQPTGSGSWIFWAFAGFALVIIVLLLVIIHMMRKPSPVVMEYSRDRIR